MPIVSNSGPILSFVRAQQFGLLQAVVGELTIPDAVYEDIVIEGAGKPGSQAVSRASWIKRRSIQDRSFLKQFPGRLHLGEQEALALAHELGATLLVDEHEARKEAHRIAIPYSGSLRLLSEAKTRGLISRVKPVVDELLASGTYLSPILYRQFLQQVGEE